ncbi:efflux transporter periplasmic adaptor subunit [Bradyrhizobium guangdongense]|uniref:efflux RND transporter periplasmic adaptor subunit n=1 Tax=Bradyrhizobium guangdongense TaxID=1325090 RepID=UPI0011298348|nr:HlyD family efflux transporter periplasmic adaptor subunit [Bradyrhizobium guangdongense]TPQ35648.1 efflux transporter periplasmic adaptor subunit [Bradyrhizobium guangdongense]
MRITGRHIAIAAGLLAIAGITAWLLIPAPVAVETAVVTKGRFVASVDEDGKTRVRQRYVVATPLAGRLSRIRFKVGDQVQVDDAVATITPSPAPLMDPRTRREVEERLGTAEANLDRAKAVVERARAQSEQANTDLTRARTLAQQGAATTQALERAELAVRLADRDLRAAEFQHHAAEHEISQMRALLARYSKEEGGQPESWNVTAPVAGVVLKVAQESETIVQPGAPLLDIGDARDLEVVVDVLSTAAVEVEPGADVTIDHWGGEGKLTGRVRRVEPAAFTKISTLGVEEQRVNVLVDILSPPERWARLGDAYQVDVQITVFARDDATIVPSGALFRHGEAWNVYVAKDGRAEVRQIELLRRSGRFAAIASGLTPGETVIAYPSDRVAPGARVAQRSR